MKKLSFCRTKGQTLVEYIVLVSLIAIVAIPAITMLGEQISQTAMDTGQAISPTMSQQ